MPLFRINGKPLLFDLINLDEAERTALTNMIESEGGGVTNDERVIVKFTARDAYDKNDPLVRTKIYDVQFIEECIRQRKILRPEHYRLDERIGDDDYHVHHLLYGKCMEPRQVYSYDGEVQLVTHTAQRRGEVWQENGGLQMVYSTKTTTGDSDTSEEHGISIDRESIDDSQPVLSAFLELEMSASSSTDDGEPVKSHDEANGERLIALKKKPKAKKALRRMPKFRQSLRPDAGDSSDSAAEATIPSVGRRCEEAPMLCEPDVMPGGVPGGWPARRSGNAIDAGPSGVRDTRKRHVEKNGEPIEGENLVRNIAHHSFLTHSIGADDAEPRAEYNTAKKTSRGQEWRAKLKSQTDAQYTGVKTRIPFTPSERKIMLRYLVKNHCIGRAKGLVVWTQMITDGYLTDRTPQSLQNQFRKCVLPNIEQVDYLEASDIQKFLALRSDRR